MSTFGDVPDPADLNVSAVSHRPSRSDHLSVPPLQLVGEYCGDSSGARTGTGNSSGGGGGSARVGLVGAAGGSGDVLRLLACGGDEQRLKASAFRVWEQGLAVRDGVCNFLF